MKRRLLTTSGGGSEKVEAQEPPWEDEEEDGEDEGLVLPGRLLLLGDASTERRPRSSGWVGPSQDASSLKREAAAVRGVQTT